jgi:hypothetical protein
VKQCSSSIDCIDSAACKNRCRELGALVWTVGVRDRLLRILLSMLGAGTKVWSVENAEWLVLL